MAATRSASPASPEPACGVAPPMPSSCTLTRTPVRLLDDADIDDAGAGVLGGVRDRLSRHEVRRGRDVVVERLAARRRGAPGSADCPVSAVSAACRPSSRLVGRSPWAICRSSATAVASSATALVEQPVHVDAALREPTLRQPHRHPERHQTLLGTVMQVALQAAPLGITDLDQPGPARLHLAQRAGELGSEPGHLDEARASRRHNAKDSRDSVAAEPLSTPI